MLVRLFPEVRASETQRFRFLLTLAALLLAGQAVGLTVSESLLLSRLGVQALPQAILAASLVTVVGSFLYSAWVGRLRHEDSFVVLLGLALAFLGFAAWSIRGGASWIYIGLFCFYCLTFTVFYTHFYTLASEYFDTLAAKRLLPLMGVGATLGEIGGGFSATFFSRVLSAQSLLYVWAGFLVLTGSLLLRARPQLREWSPSEGPTRAKRSSLGAGLAYIRRNSLGRAMVLTVGAMIMAMAVVQYVYSDIFSARFPEEQELATFLGAFLALTNVAELFIGGRLTPWLLRRYGVASTNLIHPLGALLTLALVKLDYSLVPAMLAWMNRKMLQDSLAAPTRALVFNAFPARFRGSVRGFLDGVIGSSTQALAGIGLLFLQGSLSMDVIVWVGLLLSAAYLYGAWWVRNAYLATLVENLTEGRVQLQGVEHADLDSSRLAQVWEQHLESSESAPVASFGKLLARLGQYQLLQRGLTHSNKEIRRLTASALGDKVPTSVLADECAEVRLLGARVHWKTPDLMRALRHDPDKRVQELCRAALGEEVALTPISLRHLSEERISLARQYLNADCVEMRAAAISRVGDELELNHLEKERKHPDQGVALAALEALGSSADPLARVFLADSLEDPRARIRQRAVALLSGHGSRALAQIELKFRALREVSIAAAYEAAAGIGGEQAEDLLSHELLSLTREAWVSLSLSENAKNDEVLSWALRQHARRCQRLSFKILALLEGESVVAPVESVFRFATAAARANAMEVLSNLGDREAAGLLVLMLEESSLQERLLAAKRIEPQLARLPQHQPGLSQRCAQIPSPHLPLAIRGDSRMERLYRLSSLDFFQELSLDELEEVDHLLVEERFAAGDTILEQGQTCDRLYFHLSGRTDRVGRVFGQVPALDGGSALRTLRAVDRCSFWTLDRKSLRSLVLRNPHLAFPLLRSLTAELKLAN